MKPKLYIILAVIFIVFATPRCFAADTTMVYANQLNHYYIFGGWNRFATQYNKLYVSSRIANNSSIYSETSRLKTQTNVNLDVLYALSPVLRVGLTGKYFLFKDGQTYHAYDYNQGRAGIKGDYKKQHYTIMLESGYARETRLGIRDMGWYGGMELNRNMSGLLFYPELNWDYSQMGNRRNYTFDNRINFRVKTPSLLQNTFSAGFKAYNREYYITREADTEERLNTAVYIGNDLYYPVNDNLIVDYKVEFSSTQDGLSFSYYDSKETRTRQFLSLQNDIRLRGHMGAFRAYVGFTNDYRQSRTTATNPAISLPSDYIFDKKNILARVSWKLTENDSLYINYRGSLLYYDTPDTNNYDDRDELSYSVSPAWHHRMGQYTSLSISGNIFLHHYVYLFHQRSAQNHWNRVYSLKSEINTNIPRIIRWNAKQEIYANYFVYDYEDSAFVHVQSIVFRGLKLQQSIQYYFTPKWIIRGYVFFRWEDNGLLDWKDFIQELTDSKYTIKVEVTPGYKTKQFTIAAGPVYSQRRDFRYQDIETYTESYHSIRIGGVLLLQYSNKLTLNYRLEQINQTGISRVYNQSGSLRFNWIF